MDDINRSVQKHTDRLLMYKKKYESFRWIFRNVTCFTSSHSHTSTIFFAMVKPKSHDFFVVPEMWLLSLKLKNMSGKKKKKSPVIGCLIDQCIIFFAWVLFFFFFNLYYCIGSAQADSQEAAGVSLPLAECHSAASSLSTLACTWNEVWRGQGREDSLYCL